MKLICPACTTDFTVPDGLVGPSGRKVKCAACAHIWRATPPEKAVEPDVADPGQARIDDIFASAGEPSHADAAAASVPDPSVGVSRAEPAEMAAMHDIEEAPDQQDYGDLSADMTAAGADDALASGPVGAGLLGRKRGPVKLKGARKGPSIVSVWAKRAAKAAAPLAVAAGFVLIALSIPQRDAFVRAVPDLAPLYEMVGLDVNVRGITFSQFSAQRQVVSGVALLRIDGAITNAQDEDVPLAPLRLALLAQDGAELFVWRYEPDVTGLMPGQSLPVSSELTAPPETVASVAVRFLQEGERLPGEAL